MALTQKIVTSNTALAAVALLAVLFGTSWAIVEFTPGRTLPELDPITRADDSELRSTAVRTALDVPFSPDERPDDPSLCAQIAEQLAVNYALELDTAALVTGYIDARCPNAIHQGDWDLTAQILGVGLIHEAVGKQSDPRAAALVPVAISTFDVLSPSAMCHAALGQDQPGALRFPSLVARCLDSFAQH